MSRQSNQYGSKAVDSNKRGHQQTAEASYASPAPGQSIVYTQPLTSAQSGYGQNSANQQSDQPAYETDRAWGHPNSEVHRVVNDPRLNYTYAAPEGQTSALSSNEPASTYAHHQGVSASTSNGSYRSTHELTEQQLYTHNYGQSPVSRTDVWQSESQRDGYWYGSVEQRRP